MQDRECNFKLTNKNHEPPQWFKTYMKEFEERINKRFENLITKNNLIE